jgi:chemotaxis regulatin CheY-phosphate phosphatase CheZ
MKKLLIPVLALSLSGCAGLGGLMSAPPAPSAIAGHTVADEQVMKSAELLYKTWRTAAELGVDAGVIKGDRAAKIADLDNRFYAVLKTARAAYRAFNSTDLLRAIESLNEVADEAQSITKGS